MCPHHLSIPPESVKTTQTCFYLKNGRCTNITTLSHLAHCATVIITMKVEIYQYIQYMIYTQAMVMYYLAVVGGEVDERFL